MNWQKHSVLVTGAGGFIGSHLVEALVVSGARVRAFVRYNSRNDSGLLSQISQAAIDDIEIIYGDLRDPMAVRHAVKGISTVFHLGAVISIPYSYLHPYEVVESNLMGTLNILQASLDANVKRLVHTSSSEVYGTAQQIPINEAHQLQGQSPYSASKIGADKLAESYFRSYDLPVVTVRPFNTYGPRQSARAVIPTIISQALIKSEIALGNTSPRRDLTYVSDTVNGLLKAGQVSGIEGATFNLGSGSEISIAELVDIIVKLLDRETNVVVEEIRKRPPNSEVQRLISDNTLAQDRLGWMPEVALNEGLRMTINWIRENIHLYDADSYSV